MIPPDAETVRRKTVDVNLAVTGTVESLHLEEGDRVIVTLDSDRMTTDHLDKVAAALKDEFDPHKVIILSKGLSIAKATA